MSIEQTLERIAAACETLVAGQQRVHARLDKLEAKYGIDPPAPVAAPVAPTMAPPPGPAPTNVAPFPQQAAPMPGPSGIGPGQAVPPVAAPAPMAQPAAAPAVNTGLLDQIRDAANQFHRAHPERAGEVWQILSKIGAQKIDAIPAQSQQQVLAQIQALGA